MLFGLVTAIAMSVVEEAIVKYVENQIFLIKETVLTKQVIAVLMDDVEDTSRLKSLHTVYTQLYTYNLYDSVFDSNAQKQESLQILIKQLQLGLTFKNSNENWFNSLFSNYSKLQQDRIMEYSQELQLILFVKEILPKIDIYKEIYYDIVKQIMGDSFYYLEHDIKQLNDKETRYRVCRSTKTIHGIIQSDIHSLMSNLPSKSEKEHFSHRYEQLYSSTMQFLIDLLENGPYEELVVILTSYVNPQII